MIKFKAPKQLLFDMEEIAIQAREIETGKKRPEILTNRVAVAIEADLKEQLFWAGGIEELPPAKVPKSKQPVSKSV